jgi:hypothetical protein
MSEDPSWFKFQIDALNRSHDEILEINCHLDGVNLVPLIRKPFDVLAEGLLSKNSRGDKTPIELFIAGVQGWETALRRVFAGASEDAKSS